jgi:hypothetical protein
MDECIRLGKKEKDTFMKALNAMAEFRKVFGSSLENSIVAELHVSQLLDLGICKTKNQPGFDALDSEGKRYQIKYRSRKTLNVDINNFDFDELVLVNLDQDYCPNGIWQLSVRKARKIFLSREDFRKYQITQKKFKENAKRIY